MAGETFVTDVAMPGDAVASAWTAWTPVMTATTTSPSLTTSNGRYSVVSKTVAAWFEITMNTPGNGTYYISTPVTGRYASDHTMGHGWLYHVSTAKLVQCLYRFDANGTRFRPFFTATTNIAADNSNPFAWATGDLIHGALNYEAA